MSTPRLSGRRGSGRIEGGDPRRRLDLESGEDVSRVFPLSDVRAYMGHADIQTTMVYIHHVPADDAAERLSRAVQASGDFLIGDRETGGDTAAERARSNGQAQVPGGLVPRR